MYMDKKTSARFEFARNQGLRADPGFATQCVGCGKCEQHCPQHLPIREKLKEACEGFEAMFMNMMYREMRNTVPEGGLFKKSNAMNIFEDMRDTEMMKVAAKGGGIGLADMLYKQLSPQVESQIKALQQTSEK